MGNNKNLTAVEWLWEIAYNRELTVEDWKQAKEMYKQQIIDAHNNGKNILPPNESGEQYYNETYGGGEQ
jgi:hypothetical protein